MTYANELSNKKCKLEDLIEKKIELQRAISEKQKIDANVGRRAELEDLELEIEVLQEAVESMDKYLREKSQ